MQGAGTNLHFFVEGAGCLAILTVNKHALMPEYMTAVALPLSDTFSANVFENVNFVSVRLKAF